MNDREQIAIVQIQGNRAIPVRRISNSRIVFRVAEGKQAWYVVYDNQRKRVEEELPEAEARFTPGEGVRFRGAENNHRFGKIAVVVPADQRLTSKLPAFTQAGYDITLLVGDIRARHQTSYLVAVGNQLHWPKVSSLRRHKAKR